MTRLNPTPYNARPLAVQDSNLLAIVLAFLLCFGCIFFACGAPTAVVYATGANMPAGSQAVHLIPMCAWSRHGAVGLWWNSAVAPSRAFANASRYNAVCVALPWTAALPGRGRPAVDLTP
jgi:hypothetical protein